MDASLAETTLYAFLFSAYDVVTGSLFDSRPLYFLEWSIPRSAYAFLPAVMILTIGTARRELAPSSLFIWVYAIAAAMLFQVFFLYEPYISGSFEAEWRLLRIAGYTLIALLTALVALKLVTRKGQASGLYYGASGFCLLLFNPVFFHDWIVSVRAVPIAHASPFPIAASDIAAAAMGGAMLIIWPAIVGSCAGSRAAVFLRPLFLPLSVLVLAGLSLLSFHFAYLEMKSVFSSQQL